MLIYEQVIQIDGTDSRNSEGGIRHFNYLADLNAYKSMTLKWMELGGVEISEVNFNEEESNLIIVFILNGKKMMSISQEIDVYFNRGIDEKAKACLKEKLK